MYNLNLTSVVSQIVTNILWITRSCQRSKMSAAKAPDHPPYLEMIRNAIADLKERGGSSRQAIEKYVRANFGIELDNKTNNARLKLALKKGVEKKKLIQVKGSGASGSFKNAPEEKKKKEKPKPKKPAAKPKKPKAKEAKSKGKSPKTKPAAKKGTPSKTKKTKTTKPTAKKAAKAAAKKVAKKSAKGTPKKTAKKPTKKTPKKAGSKKQSSK